MTNVDLASFQRGQTLHLHVTPSTVGWVERQRSPTLHRESLVCSRLAVKTKTLIIALVVLLIGSNAYWLHATIDAAVSTMYQEQEKYSLERAEKQARGMLEESLQGRLREDVIQLAVKHSDLKPYEKDGCVWVDAYGFKFAESGAFVGIQTGVGLTPDSLCPEPGL